MLINKLVGKSDLDCTDLQPFLLHHDLLVESDRLKPTISHGKWSLAESKPESEIEAPPFELFSLELEDQFAIAGADGKLIKCLIVKEVAPGEYQFVAMAFEGDRTDMAIVYHVNSNHQPLYGYLVNVTNTMLAVIHDEARGQVRMPGKGRYRDANGKKKEFRPTNTVYIYPKSMTTLTETAKAGRPVKPMTRHWVRAHWRRLQNPESLGKNRKGERCVKGFTWVINHTKGDKGDPTAKVHKVR